VVRTGKESWPGMTLCPVASLHSEWGVRGRGWYSCACVHASRDSSDPCLPLSVGKTFNWLKLGSLVRTPWPRIAKDKGVLP